MKFDICWHGDPPDEEIGAATVKDLTESFYHDGECEIAGGPGGLMFHHIFLTDDMEGPCVFVWGSENTPTTFHCEYHSETEWVSPPRGEH